MFKIFQEINSTKAFSVLLPGAYFNYVSHLGHGICRWLDEVMELAKVQRIQNKLDIWVYAAVTVARNRRESDAKVTASLAADNSNNWWKLPATRYLHILLNIKTRNRLCWTSRDYQVFLPGKISTLYNSDSGCRARFETKGSPSLFQWLLKEMHIFHSGSGNIKGKLGQAHNERLLTKSET